MLGQSGLPHLLQGAEGGLDRKEAGARCSSCSSSFTPPLQEPAALPALPYLLPSGRGVGSNLCQTECLGAGGPELQVSEVCGGGATLPQVPGCLRHRVQTECLRVTGYGGEGQGGS